MLNCPRCKVRNERSTHCSTLYTLNKMPSLSRGTCVWNGLFPSVEQRCGTRLGLVPRNMPEKALLRFQLFFMGNAVWNTSVPHTVNVWNPPAFRATLGVPQGTSSQKLGGLPGPLCGTLHTLCGERSVPQCGTEVWNKAWACSA